ncbi:hypothetical protein [Sediminibacillus sp. JSM 1682029]|uniref:AAA family ATPase n=1 Tax=Sediminibacillus sp. JSM 1682029 TaxID=3229857 RepID=UPI0035258259
MSIIYGPNGTGKSGYTRLLKHICGAKNKGKLLHNIYDTSNNEQVCTLNYRIGSEKQVIKWNAKDGILDPLRYVEIYDSETALDYINQENEATYEPWVLTILTKLIEICTYVQKSIDEEIQQSETSLNKLPFEFKKTDIGIWYESLSHKTTPQSINEKCAWSEELSEEEESIKARLSELNPAQKAKDLKNTHDNLSSLQQMINKIVDELSFENCKKVISKNYEAVKKRRAAEQTATKVFKDFPLDGVDSETWKVLWEKARLFSERYAYQEKTFPHVEENSLCVLCQQPLDKEAKDRFMTFESYIKGALENEAKSAEISLEKHIDSMTEIPEAKSIKLLMDSALITRNEERAKIEKVFDMLSKRKETLLNHFSIEKYMPLPEFDNINFIKEKIAALRKSIAYYEKDAHMKDDEKMNLRLLDLKALYWISHQKQNIEKEVGKLAHVEKLNKAKRKASTRPLSVKKSQLSEVLITEAYVSRFRKELEFLGASHLKIELIKTRTRRGQVLHEIKLNNTSVKATTSEVLSEGEQRVVSLAAFLADVEGKPQNSPFVFDDPISSLDIIYEESTVNRLIELSNQRQVIVFSHRISLVTLLESMAERKKVEHKIIGLRREGTRTGETGDTPLFAKKPEKALNKLKNEKLDKAKRILNEFGEEEYQLIAKGITSEFRILLERLVESILLRDIVKRFRREINTKGKIHQLPKITKSDVAVLDEYMTKYSKYEHSQSVETPITLPLPDELQNDMEIVKNWIEDFKKR